MVPHESGRVGVMNDEFGWRVDNLFLFLTICKLMEVEPALQLGYGRLFIVDSVPLGVGWLPYRYP